MRSFIQEIGAESRLELINDINLIILLPMQVLEQRVSLDSKVFALTY